MTPLRLILAGLWHHRRIHLAVMAGVAATTAVLTGAFLVGDSVRGSLTALTLDRLGQIDEVIVTEHFFRQDLARELASQKTFSEHFSAAVPILLLRGSVDKPSGAETVRSSQVAVIGCEPDFWQLGTESPSVMPGPNEVVLNAPLAEKLSAQVGDEVLLRIPRAAEIPSESPLGKKSSDALASRRLTVCAIVPARGLGRFGLSPSQRLPRNAYVSIATLQAAIDQQSKVNALLVASRSGRGSTPAESQALKNALAPQPADYGLTIRRVRIGSHDSPANEYFDITSQQMLLPAPVVVAAQKAFKSDSLQPALTYLANSISAGDRMIPYSTVTGIDSTAALGPLPVDASQPLGANEIVLNRWAADDLQVQPGDEIALRWYEPESTDGKLVEPAPALFRVRSIVPLVDDDDRPTAADDPNLTPELRGVTDKKSIDDWELPFKLVHKIRQADDDYWEEFRTTPKAFLSLARAQELWKSRFGDLTSLRIPTALGLDEQTLFARLQLDPASLGLKFRPIKRLALEASAGTTPFNALFLGFSCFIIASATMLTALLFRLGVEQRGREVGLLAAIGWRLRKIARILTGEGLLVSGIGALVGIVAGIGYAWLMLVGLQTAWLAAISTPFLELHITPLSLALGFGVGLAISLLAILWGLTRLARRSAMALGSNYAGDQLPSLRKNSTRTRRIGQAMLLGAVLVGFLALGSTGPAQAGAFLGSGSLVLGWSLLAIWERLAYRRPASERAPSLVKLAMANAARNPGRSTLTIGLVSAASFLILATSAFRLAPNPEGVGGFALVAESDQPILHDLNSPAGRSELGFSTRESQHFADCRSYAFRVRAGDDASCLNLYRPQQPRSLGVPASFIERGRFDWAGSEAQTDAERQNPWLLLNKKFPDGSIPTIADAATVTYSLHKSLGDTLEIEGEQGQKQRLRIVGLLSNSIFQGDLLLGEPQFLSIYPQTAGSRFFLLDLPQNTETGNVAMVGKILDRALGEWGFEAVPADQRLAEFMAVQNTYLSTFQSLGGLGLLLGTFGLAAVQLRSVLERRGELALLRAAGFRRSRLASLILLENVTLLLAGLGSGIFAALIAVLPHWIGGGAGVPWLSLATMLLVIFVVGVLASGIAVRAVLRAPVLAALRADY